MWTIRDVALKEAGEAAEGIAMFRTAAALLAKKTAIVAITGVTVIGGASLALAVGTTQSSDSASIEGDTDQATDTGQETPDGCADESTDDDGSLTGDDTAGSDDTSSDDDTNASDGSTGDSDVTAPACHDDGDAALDGDEDGGELGGDEAGEEAEVDEPEGEDLDGVAEVTADDPTEVEVAEDDHGAAVSEAARVGCRTEEAVEQYRNHGQCVREVAHDKGEAGDDSETEVAEPEGSDDAGTQTVTEEPAEEPAEKPAKAEAKPAHAGGGKGKGPKG